MTSSSTSAFRSLSNRNYRVWAAGAFVSNIGTWMQRTAQDWLVLTQLTHHNASAVGVVMALQFGPQMALLPLTGYAADHMDQRKLLMLTQSTMGVLALLLGLLTVTGVVRLWEVNVFALLFGCTTAFDAPVRQVFVSALVGDKDLPNAVALNATSFNAARMIGPAAAGALIAAVGTGWAFLLNGVSFIAVLYSLYSLRISDLHLQERAKRGKGSLVAGFRYVWSRDDLKTVLIMLFFVGTFGLNFALFISTMAVSVFHLDAGHYGMLSSAMAAGTVSGAFLGAKRALPRFRIVMIGSLVFGVGCTAAAAASNEWYFAAALVLIGVAALTVTNSSSSLMQLSTEPAMRGRVMAIRMAVALGCTPLGAPTVGWVADHFGARCGLLVGAACGFAAAAYGGWAWMKSKRWPR